MSAEPIPYLEQLRGELVNGAARAHTHRARRRRAVTAAAIPVAAGALVLASGTIDGGKRSSALAVTKTRHATVLRLADPGAGGGQLTRDLHAAGIDGDVRTEPVSPSLVGTWRARFVPGDADTSQSQDDFKAASVSIVGRAPTALVPSDFKGEAKLVVGRAARPGELYAFSGSAFGPGEALHCSGIDHLSPAEAERAIAAKGFRVHTVGTGPLAERPHQGDRGGAARYVADAQVLAQPDRSDEMAQPVLQAAVGADSRDLAKLPAPTTQREMVLFVSSSREAVPSDETRSEGCPR